MNRESRKEWKSATAVKEGLIRAARREKILRFGGRGLEGTWSEFVPNPPPLGWGGPSQKFGT